MWLTCSAKTARIWNTKRNIVTVNPDSVQNKHPPAKPVVLLMRAKPSVPRRHVKRVSTTCQLRKMAFLLPVILSLPKLKSYCLLDGFALPGLLILFHLTLISDTPYYVFCTVGRLHFFHGRESHFFHRHRLNGTTRLSRGFLYTIRELARARVVSRVMRKFNLQTPAE